MQYSDIKTLFYTMIGESADTPVYVSGAMAASFATAGVKRLVEDSTCLETRVIKGVTAGTQEYDLPDDCRRVMRVAYDDQKILPITHQDLRNHNPRWRDHSGTPRFYYLDEMNEKIGLYENPGTSSTYAEVSGGADGFIVDMSGADGGDGFIFDIRDVPYGGTDGFITDIITGFELEIIYQADSPAGITDDTAIPAWARGAILYYMLYMAYSQDTVIADQEKAVFWYGMFLRSLSRLRVRAASKLAHDWVREMTYTGQHDPVFRLMPEHIEES